MSNQAEVLLSLIQGSGGNEFASEATGWTTSSSEPVCSWDGIYCDLNDKVLSVSLLSRGLFGAIPPQLGQLTSLKTLMLSDNRMSGRIPPQVAALPRLEVFDVGYNRVTGSIPSFTSSFLRSFNATSNLLVGTLSDDVGHLHQSLEKYDVSGNFLTGTLPRSFREMTNLDTLDVSENGFTGTIPPNLGDLMRLKNVYADENRLVGPIPPNLARPRIAEDPGGSVMTELWLQDNLLSGTVPAALSDLSHLTAVYIDGNKFTGTIPSSLCRADINTDFYEYVPPEVNRNYCDSVACPTGTAAFEGVYPCRPCQMSYFNPYLGRTGECIDTNQRHILMRLNESASKKGPWSGENNWDDNVAICDFSGVACDAKGNVVSIDLKNRGLTGTIPEELGFLSYLDSLDLSNNFLTGLLPSDLRWAPLRYLDVSGNYIKGVVPPMLCLQGELNGDGARGDYDCDRIACPAGTYSTTGMAGSGFVCAPCVGGRAIGSKRCSGAIAVHAHPAGVGHFFAVLFMTFFFIVGTFLVLTCKPCNLERFWRKEEILQEDELKDLEGFQRNPNAMSFSPYSKDKGECDGDDDRKSPFTLT